jgi:hypothetical protein
MRTSKAKFGMAALVALAGILVGVAGAEARPKDLSAPRAPGGGGGAAFACNSPYEWRRVCVKHDPNLAGKCPALGCTDEDCVQWKRKCVNSGIAH